MWLYQKRILGLEEAFDRLRERMRKLSDEPEELNNTEQKVQLDLVLVDLRVLKEQTAYYAKLGESYDLARFHIDLLDELRDRDPILALEIVHAIEARWKK
jgi:hypothetical protein